MLIDSDHCGEYVLLGQVCDLAVLPAALARMEEQFLKLRAEEKKVTELKCKVKARRDRLQKQILVVRQRHAAMVATELCNIEEQERDEAIWEDPSVFALSVPLDFSLPVDSPAGVLEVLSSSVAPDDDGGSPAEPSLM